MNIDFSFRVLKATRNNVLKVLESLSNEQLNTIPKGFNNNLIWNAGHIWITQELLCYKLSGLECSMDNEMIQKYRKGSKPELNVSDEEIARIKSELLLSIDRMEKDFKEGVFKEYNEYTTSYNVTLSNINDAISFNNIHEGLHLGSLLALKKMV